VELAFKHLCGRAYVPGEVHCYSLVRDFFHDNFGLSLANYAVPHDWNADKLDLINKIYEREGFEKVENWSLKTLRPADVLCVAFRAHNANHLVINVGGNQILHHPVAQLSRTDPFKDFWRMSTCYVLRHPEVPDLTPTKPDTTIQELIDARYRRVKAEA
jgi:cell wall-associated NlpC family hydrolase